MIRSCVGQLTLKLLVQHIDLGISLVHNMVKLDLGAVQLVRQGLGHVLLVDTGSH